MNIQRWNFENRVIGLFDSGNNLIGKFIANPYDMPLLSGGDFWEGVMLKRGWKIFTIVLSEAEKERMGLVGKVYP